MYVINIQEDEVHHLNSSLMSLHLATLVPLLPYWWVNIIPTHYPRSCYAEEEEGICQKIIGHPK